GADAVCISASTSPNPSIEFNMNGSLWFNLISCPSTFSNVISIKFPTPQPYVLMPLCSFLIFLMESDVWHYCWLNSEQSRQVYHCFYCPAQIQGHSLSYSKFFLDLLSC